MSKLPYISIWEVESIAAAAPGWRAIYESQGDPAGYFEAPVACWAVLRFTSGAYSAWDDDGDGLPVWAGQPRTERHVHAMVAGEDGELEPVEPQRDVCVNFWGVLGPGEDIERLGLAPSQRRKQGK